MDSRSRIASQISVLVYAPLSHLSSKPEAQISACTLLIATPDATAYCPQAHRVVKGAKRIPQINENGFYNHFLHPYESDKVWLQDRFKIR